MALVRAFQPEGQKVNLGSQCVAALGVYGLNGVLRWQGLAIHHDLPSQEVPELVVKVRTAEASWEAATWVWLAPYEPESEAMGPNGLPAKYIVSGIYRSRA